MAEETRGRKPPGLSWESWIERQIRDGMDRGEFDALAGRGRPIPGIEQRRDVDAWIRRKLRDEDAAPPPPPAIQIRIEVDAAMASLPGLETEAQVRELADHLNHRIRTVNRTVVVGPATTVGPIPPDELLERWRNSRSVSGLEPS